MLASNYIPEGENVTLQSENGVLGLVRGMFRVCTRPTHTSYSNTLSAPWVQSIHVFAVVHVFTDTFRVHFLMRERRTLT